ncbi:MAG: shikimate kinase [Dehalococcoidales bacterium]|jgi:shikimate kinase
MKTNIALIGFMAAGKTAVARQLAQRLDKKLVELDALIEQRAGKTVARIFAEDGETAFREWEIALIKEVAVARNQVIATGGGIVLNTINVDRLRQGGVIVYLEASPTAILKRAQASTAVRPLLAGEDKAGIIEKMLRFRQPYYDRAADIRLDTSAIAVNAVAGRIIELLKQYEDFTP